MKIRKELSLAILSASLIFSGCSSHEKAENVDKKIPPIHKKETNQRTSESNTGSTIHVQQVGHFNNLYMINNRVGWALTDKGIMSYTDGSWKKVTPSQLKSENETTSLYAYDEKTAFLKIGNKVFYTSDGGQSWKESSISPSKDKEKLLAATFSFINGSTGWMLVQNGMATGHSPFDIYRTTNKGKNWELVNHVGYGQKNKDGLSDTINPNKIAFINSTLGFISGDANDENEVIFYKTKDSGKTWGQVHLPLPKRNQGELISIDRPQFFNSNEAILPVIIRGSKRDFTVFFTTIDQGSTWKLLSKISGSGEVTFLNRSLGWANFKPSISQENSSIFSTKDGGKSWTKLSDLPITLHNLQFTSELIGWGLNENTLQVMKTEDGGITWK